MTQNISNIVQHSYDTPGYYFVNITVSTTAGNRSVTTGVFIEGTYSCVKLLLNYFDVNYPNYT